MIMIDERLAWSILVFLCVMIIFFLGIAGMLIQDQSEKHKKNEGEVALTMACGIICMLLAGFLVGGIAQ